MKKELFGTTKDGREIYRYLLENEQGMKACILTYGAILQSLLVPDAKGNLADVCLGYDKLESYYQNSACFGSTIGPNCNRIADGEFELNGVKCVLSQNESDKHNNLHSDSILGFHKQVWEAKEDGENSLVLFLKSPDGEMGFPGNKTVTVTYTLTQFNELKISYIGFSDKTTVFNMTNHTYFNLGGHASGSVEGHKLTLKASAYTPINARMIPTGTVEPVLGTPMDFTEGKKIGQDINGKFEQLKLAGGYDHNYVLDDYDGKLREFALLEDEASGRKMKVYTDRPGVQLYTGNFIHKEQGKEGVLYGDRHGVCLETQNYPNAVNEPAFPSPVYAANSTYATTTIFQFL